MCTTHTFKHGETEIEIENVYACEVDETETKVNLINYNNSINNTRILKYSAFLRSKAVKKKLRNSGQKLVTLVVELGKS